ncbi:MAG: TlpA family protein disulfide reductase [Candidatus Thorarchaeota archaeon]
MESEHMLLAGLVIVIVSVGLVVGVSMIGFEATPSNTNTTPSLVPDVDLIDQSRKAPNWGLLLSDGEILELNSLEGSFVLIDLMGLACPACETMNEEIAQIRDDMGTTIVVVSLVVSYGIDISDVSDYKADKGLDWDHGIDTNNVFSEYFNVRVTPTLVLIDDDGYFRMYHEGVWTSSTVQELVSLMNR